MYFIVTPHRPRGARNFSKSVPLNYKSNVVDTPKQFETRKPNPGPSSTFDRTAWVIMNIITLVILY